MRGSREGTGGGGGVELNKREGGVCGAIVVIPGGGEVLVVGVEVVVDSPWVPGSVREPPNAVLSPAFRSPALDAPVDGCSFVVTFRHGRRDRGKFVEGGGLD